MKKIILLLSVFLFLSCGESKPKTSIDKSEAKVYAEMKIKQYLKAPSTAKFSRYNTTIFTSVIYQGLKGYKVKGYVNAKNGFGGLTRKEYSVEIYYNPKDGGIKTRNVKLY